MFEGFSFQELLIFLLLGALFFKEQIWALIESRLGVKNLEEKKPVWASSLEGYFNHDTTEFHTKTHDKLDRLLLMEEKEHEASAEMRDTLKDIGNTLKNIDRYGVRCNDK